MRRAADAEAGGGQRRRQEREGGRLGPASDKLPKGDYVDCVWLSNSRGSILRAAEFKPLGKAINAAASTDATPVRPTIEFRVDKGNQVVPFIHCASGATFQGAAVDL